MKVPRRARRPARENRRREHRALHGTLVSAARICYPDQHAFKLMTDVPNGSPEWADDGFVSLGGYMKGYLAVGAVVPTPNPPSVIVTPPAVDLSGLRAQLEGILVNQQALKQELDEHVRADGDAHAVDQSERERWPRRVARSATRVNRFEVHHDDVAPAVSVYLVRHERLQVTHENTRRLRSGSISPAAASHWLTARPQILPRTELSPGALAIDPATSSRSPSRPSARRSGASTTATSIFR
jgi:hypothetical protein